MTAGDVVAMAKTAVETFFRVYEGETPIGMIVPSGWYGRPWDNYYNLRRVAVMDDLIEVDLSHGYKVSMLIQRVHAPSRAELCLSGSDIRVSSMDNTRSYRSGSVRFVVAEQSPIVDRMARDAAIDLRTLPFEE